MNALDFALKMELDGEQYYRELSQKNKDNSLYVVFDSLAEDEKYHYEIIRQRIAKSTGHLKRNNELGESKTIFDSTSMAIKELKAAPDQLDAYVIALGNEKKSIDLYKKLFDETNGDNEKKFFEALVKEEQSHYNIIDDMIGMLIKPVEWVESAEFGITKEY